MRGPLTVVSYNIHSGVGPDGRADLARIAEVLREVSADLIALQEVGDVHRRVADPPERLADLLGFSMVFAPTMVQGNRRYGNAILSRSPILDSYHYDLSVRRREPRGALRCDVQLEDGRPLHLFCVHLGLRARERRRQEALLLSAAILQEAARCDPLIVCGDFNYWRPMPHPFRTGVVDVARMLRNRHPTYPARWPLFRLDRIYVDRGVRPVDIHVHESRAARSASDHFPLVMRFEVPEPITATEGGTLQRVDGQRAVGG